MTKIPIQCACGKKYQIAEAMCGKKVRCPACERTFTAPSLESESVENGHSEVDFASGDLASFLDESLATDPPPADPFAPSPLGASSFEANSSSVASSNAELEREQNEIDAELSDLKEQIREEFQIGHSILKARGRLNQQLEQARANAPVETRRMGGMHGAAFLLAFVAGVPGIAVALLLSAFWPQRTVRAKVNFGADEMADINSMARFGRRRAVGAQARSEALHTLIARTQGFTARITATLGSTAIGAAVCLGLVLFAAAMTFVNPLFGILFVAIGVFFGFHVRRKLTALDQALGDYPLTAARFGRRWMKGPLSALVVFGIAITTLAAIGWVGLATYRWGNSIVVWAQNGFESQADDVPEKSPPLTTDPVGEGALTASNKSETPTAGEAPATEPSLLPDTPWGKYRRMQKTTWQIAVPHAHEWSPDGYVPPKSRAGILSALTSTHSIRLEGVGEVDLTITESLFDDSAQRKDSEDLLESEYNLCRQGFDGDLKGTRRLDERFAPAAAVDYLIEGKSNRDRQWIMLVVTADKKRIYAVVAKWNKEPDEEQNLEALAHLMATFRVDPPMATPEG